MINDTHLGNAPFRSGTDVSVNRVRVTPRALPWLIIAFALQLCAVAPAQSLWEVTPYRVRIWVMTESDPRVPGVWEDQLREQLPALAQSQVGAAWTTTARAVPAELQIDMLADLDVSYDLLQQHDDTLRETDKLFVCVIRNLRDAYMLTVREFDFAARRWGPTLQRRLAAPRQLNSASLELVCEAFSPLVRIESVEDSSVVVSVRGSALVRPARSPRRWDLPVEVVAGDVLQAIQRRADRSGNVGPKGVELVKWTVLVAADKRGERFVCNWASGYRQPFRNSRSSRIEQLAIRVRPLRDATTIKLVDRKQPDRPLVGYEVHAKSTDEGSPSEFVGRSDWRGKVVVPRQADQPVRVLFVRNGQQLLGKLPVVPGVDAELVAPLRNDDLRLEAEGFLIGVQDSLVDLIARREVLAVRIRRHLQDGELEKADALIKQLRRLETREDFSRRVERRKLALKSNDANVQRKVDELFQQTASLLTRYLDREQVDTLARTLAAARTGAGPTKPAP